jgi:hypothetical protein
VGKKLGNDYRIWVESATPGTFNEIKGQVSTTINRSGGTIDTGSKSDFPYGTAAPGSRSLSIPFTIRPDLPDANGYTRLETLALAAVQAPFNIQIRKGGSAGSGTDVVFACSVYVTDFNTPMDQNSVVAVSGTFVAAAAPTTDVLA